MLVLGGLIILLARANQRFLDIQLADAIEHCKWTEARQAVLTGADVNAEGDQTANSNAIVQWIGRHILGKDQIANLPLRAHAPALLLLYQNAMPVEPAGELPGPNPEFVTFLIDHKADIHATDKDGNSVLWYAAYFENASIVERILSLGGNSNQQCGRLRTTALMHSPTAVTRVLLRYGAKVDVSDVNGWTALDYAALGVHTGKVQLLLENGAAATLNEEKQRHAVEIARRFGNATDAHLLAQPFGLSDR